MGVTSKISALVLVVAALSTDVTALGFNYRFYDNGGCNHSSPTADTFPLNSLPPLAGSSSECLSAPTGINWNRLEVDNSLSTGEFILITFCHTDCTAATASRRGTRTASCLPLVVLSGPSPSFRCRRW
ncbi:hypothetical protein BJ912DRAFT_1149960 [Pholiota molesta]|nr:hypothetical protein BJ912DRAFT_1149960 [Pholiota molesta]